MADVEEIERLVVSFEMNLQAIGDGCVNAIRTSIDRGELSPEAAERICDDIAAVVDKLVEVRLSDDA